MSWTDIIKNEYFDFAGDMDGTAADMDRENSDRIAEYKRAKGFLKQDIANVIRELGELQEMMESGQTMDYYANRLPSNQRLPYNSPRVSLVTNEMKKLSDALGKVSVLLQ